MQTIAPKTSNKSNKGCVILLRGRSDGPVRQLTVWLQSEASAAILTIESLTGCSKRHGFPPRRAQTGNSHICLLPRLQCYCVARVCNTFLMWCHLPNVTLQLLRFDGATTHKLKLQTHVTKEFLSFSRWQSTDITRAHMYGPKGSNIIKCRLGDPAPEEQDQHLRTMAPLSRPGWMDCKSILNKAQEFHHGDRGVGGGTKFTRPEDQFKDNKYWSVEHFKTIFFWRWLWTCEQVTFKSEQNLDTAKLSCYTLQSWRSNFLLGQLIEWWPCKASTTMQGIVSLSRTAQRSNETILWMVAVWYVCWHPFKDISERPLQALRSASKVHGASHCFIHIPESVPHVFVGAIRCKHGTTWQAWSAKGIKQFREF